MVHIHNGVKLRKKTTRQFLAGWEQDRQPSYLAKEANWSYPNPIFESLSI